MRRCATFTLLAGTLAVAAVCATATAHVTRQTVQELAVESDRIVVGDVASVTAELDPVSSVITSRVTVHVTDQLKGAGPETVVLSVLGGTVGDLSMSTCISPTFLAGDHVLLFLEGAQPRLRGAWQGAWLTDGALTVQMSVGNQRFIPDGVEPFENLLDAIERALPPDTMSKTVSPYAGGFSLQGGAAWTLNGCDWTWQANPMGETYRINANCSDTGCDDAGLTTDAILAGAEAWNQAGADFSFSYAGPSGSTNAPSFNNLNLVVFQNSPGIDPGAIAVTYYWCSGDNMTEWDMVFNDFHFNFWDGVGPCNGRYDIQGVGTHEFGHALGLGHTNVNGATMYPTTGPCNTAARSLEADDIAGVQFIYGVDQTPPTNDSCSVPFPVMPNEVVSFDNFNANTDGFSEACGQIDSDVWFRYTAQCDAQVLVRLCDSQFDTKLAVYEFPCASGPNQAIACNDDFCGDRSQLTFPAQELSTYLIRVGGAGGTEGQGQLFLFVTCDPEDPCPTDVNGDGTTDVQDMTLLILAWGTDDADADVNDDGTVNVADLTELVLAWGDCP